MIFCRVATKSDGVDNLIQLDFDPPACLVGRTEGVGLANTKFPYLVKKFNSNPGL